jgi:hypothetical protein
MMYVLVQLTPETKAIAVSEDWNLLLDELDELDAVQNEREDWEGPHELYTWRIDTVMELI